VPDVEAVAFCRRVRERHPALPVLMLSADGSELDEVQGLDAGADDYVARPFTLAVLAARVRALLRREANIEAAGVRLDRAARLAWRDERELELAPKEFDLLATLVAHAGTVLSRDELMRLVWDANWFGSTKTLDVHVGWLRAKLGEPPLITTVRGVGFRFERP
jgi:DNA-binding response OmpR family regulator